MGALRYNTGKAPISYIFELPKALEALARVFEQGAIKYERGNWKKGGKPDAEYLDSAGRHLLKFVSGEVYDPETGALHLAHALWNIAVLIELNHDLPLFDPDFDQTEFEAHWARAENQPKIKTPIFQHDFASGQYLRLEDIPGRLYFVHSVTPTSIDASYRDTPMSPDSLVYTYTGLALREFHPAAESYVAAWKNGSLVS